MQLGHSDYRFGVNLEYLNHFGWVLDLCSRHWAQDLAVRCIAIASQNQQFPKLSVSYWYLGVVWVTALHRQRESIFFLLSNRLIVQELLQTEQFAWYPSTHKLLPSQGNCQEYTGSRVLGTAWCLRHGSLIMLILTWRCLYNRYSLSQNAFGELGGKDTTPSSCLLVRWKAILKKSRIWTLTMILIKIVTQERLFCFEHYSHLPLGDLGRSLHKVKARSNGSSTPFSEYCTRSWDLSLTEHQCEVAVIDLFLTWSLHLSSF